MNKWFRLAQLSFGQIVLALALLTGGASISYGFDLPADFGQEDGTGLASGFDELGELLWERTGHAEVIGLLSHSTSTLTLPRENPFGHIAFGVWNEERKEYVVLTANQHALPTDTSLFYDVSLKDYLYAIDAAEPLEFGSNRGVAWARDTIAIALNGFSADQLIAGRAEVERIADEFRQGQLTFSLSGNNCARLTQRVMMAAGIDSTVRHYSLPVEIFRDFATYAMSDEAKTATMIAFPRVPGSHSTLKSFYPLSLYDLLSTLRGFVGFSEQWSMERATLVVTTDKADPYRLVTLQSGDSPRQ